MNPARCISGGEKHAVKNQILVSDLAMCSPTMDSKKLILCTLWEVLNVG